MKILFTISLVALIYVLHVCSTGQYLCLIFTALCVCVTIFARYLMCVCFLVFWFLQFPLRCIPCIGTAVPTPPGLRLGLNRSWTWSTATAAIKPSCKSAHNISKFLSERDNNYYELIMNSVVWSCKNCCYEWDGSTGRHYVKLCPLEMAPVFLHIQL